MSLGRHLTAWLINDHANVHLSIPVQSEQFKTVQIARHVIALISQLSIKPLGFSLLQRNQSVAVAGQEHANSFSFC